MFAGLIPVATHVTDLIRRIARDRRGIETVEWTVVAAIIIVVAVRAYSALSYAGIGAFFNGLAAGFTNLNINL